MLQIQEPILVAQGIKKGFRLPGGDTFWALRGIDLSVPSGKLTILRGKSGSGKTTLMNIMSALDDPTEGSVELRLPDREPIRMESLTEKERAALRRKTIGFVFQSVALIPIMTARENVELALRLGGWTENREKRAKECLELVGLGARMDHMPSEMSGGEQQRVAIARAIAHSPQVVFADEPTGELDTNTAISVVRLFKELNADLGITIVMTTHDRGFMEIGDAVYELEGGELIGERAGSAHDRV